MDCLALALCPSLSAFPLITALRELFSFCFASGLHLLSEHQTYYKLHKHNSLYIFHYYSLYVTNKCFFILFVYFNSLKKS
jgi:hypothetical protein